MKCGETEKQIGGAEREFIHGAAINFLTPFRNFLEGDFKTILVRHTSWNTVVLMGPPAGHRAFTSRFERFITSGRTSS